MLQVLLPEYLGSQGALDARGNELAQHVYDLIMAQMTCLAPDGSWQAALGKADNVAIATCDFETIPEAKRETIILRRPEARTT